MRKRRYVLFAGLLAVIVSVAILWAVVRPHDPLFRGKPESQWIEQLSYLDEEQVEQWREFGPDGVRVLVRGLEGTDRPRDKVYRNAYRWMASILPGGVMGLLPAPRDDVTYRTRMNIIGLLSGLGKDAQMAVPAMARALRDETAGVQMLAINFFTDTEGEDALLNQLPDEEKRRHLPDFVSAIENSRDWGVRNNAAVALSYYPDEREVVVPVLANALSDPVPTVRLVAARALHRVAPDAVLTEEVVPAVIIVLGDPDAQVAAEAARLLGVLGEEPSLAVPALIQSAQGTNCLVASAAANAFGSFPDQAEIIVPVLLQAYQDTNRIVSRRAITRALNKVDPAAAVNAGMN